jgi:hypothetical protein
MNQPPDFTPKMYLFVNKILFSAILMATMIITVVFIAVTEDHYFNMDFNESPFMLMVPIVTVIGLGVSNGIFKVYTKQAREKKGLKAKLNQYRIAVIIRLALTEGPAIFAAVAFMQEGNHFYLLFSIICIALMITYNPKEQRLIKDLDLRGDELDQFKNKESKIR